MNCLPVIEMELRSAAQRRGTVWLRLFFALAGMTACLVVLVLPRLAPARKGSIMLIVLTGLSFVFCMFAGGFLTADCVSREKREGTLGLLFLTPLSGLDIAIGKMVCHSLQTFYGMCAAIPIFFLPLFVGGVTGGEVCRILLALGLTMLLAAAVGRFVSVLGVESRQTIMTTFGSLLLAAGLPMVWLMLAHYVLRGRHAWNYLAGLSPMFTVTRGFDAYYRAWPGPKDYWTSVLVMTGMSLCLVVLSGILLARVFRALGTERGTASAPARGARVALAPALRRNPYEWLVLRGSDEWRLLGVVNTTLLILYGTVLVVSVTTSYWQLGFSTAFFTALGIHVITKLRFAVEATRQIHSDRQGGLEFLLVTPLSEREIIDGYHRALRALAGKPLALMIGLNFVLEACVILFPNKLHMGRGAGGSFTVIFLGGAGLAAADLVAIRWLALRHGLRASSHVKAVLGTFGWLKVVPWIGFGLAVAAISTLRSSDNATVACIFAGWLVTALVYDALLIMRCRDQMRGTPLTSGVFRS